MVQAVSPSYHDKTAHSYTIAASCAATSGRAIYCNAVREVSMMQRLLPLIIALAVTFDATAATESVALPGERAFPESISSSKDGTLYVSNLANGGITRIEPNSSEAKVWIEPGTFGTHSTFGVLVDEKAGLLWVCSNDLSARGMGVGTPDGVSALFAFDLKTGVGKISVPFPSKPSTCNDITIGPDGAAYVTNTAAPQVLRLAKGAKKLEIWFTEPSLQPEKGGGLDGLAFGADGNLYVNTVGPGELYRIDVKGGKATRLTKLTPSRPLFHTDGMRRYGKDFLLI